MVVFFSDTQINPTFPSLRSIHYQFLASLVSSELHPLVPPSKKEKQPPPKKRLP